MYSLQDCYNTPKNSNLRNSGIYCIENIENGKQYIGSTCNCFSKRFREHFNALKKNKHHSQILQRSFNKYAIHSFSLKILEVVDSSDYKVLRDREQYWLDTFQPYYNILPNSQSFSGYIHSEELKQKQSKETRNRFKDKETGVKYYPKYYNWGVNIRVRGFRVHALGRFKTKEEALAVRKEAEAIFWTDEFDNLSLEEKKKFVEKYQKSKPTNDSTTGYRYISNVSTKTKPYRFYYKSSGISRFFLTLEEAVEFRDKYLEENNLI